MVLMAIALAAATVPRAGNAELAQHVNELAQECVRIGVVHEPKFLGFLPPLKLVSKQDETVLRFSNAFLEVDLDKVSKRVLRLLHSWDDKLPPVQGFTSEDYLEKANAIYRAYGYRDRLIWGQSTIPFFVATRLHEGVPFNHLLHGVHFQFDARNGMLISMSTRGGFPRPPSQPPAGEDRRPSALWKAASAVLAQKANALVEEGRAQKEIASLGFTPRVPDEMARLGMDYYDGRSTSDIAGFEIGQGIYAYAVAIRELDENLTMQALWQVWLSEDVHRLLFARRIPNLPLQPVAKLITAPLIHPEALVKPDSLIKITAKPIHAASAPKEEGDRVILKSGKYYFNGKVHRNIVRANILGEERAWDFSID